jgi:hypothetical protein
MRDVDGHGAVLDLGQVEVDEEGTYRWSEENQ